MNGYRGLHFEDPNVTPPGHGDPASQRILVVDDDIGMRRLSTLALSQRGYSVEAAEDGAIAWAALNGGNYDMMITDNNMPKVTGVELLRKLRAARMALPVIMVTGAPPEFEFSQSPWLLPDATLLKPFSVEELLEKVEFVFRANAVVPMRSAAPGLGSPAGAVEPNNLF